MNIDTLVLVSSADTENFGRRLAQLCQPPLILYLHGELGAGKTTLVRGFLRGKGYEGLVKSPTYTLVEPYALAGMVVYHFDLYRLGEAEELDYLGVRDYLNEQAICLLEWPTRGEGFVPPPDIHLHLEYQDCERLLSFHAPTVQGQAVLMQLSTGQY